MSAAGSDSDAETVITEGTIEREKGSKEKGTLGKVSQITTSKHETEMIRIHFYRVRMENPRAFRLLPILDPLRARDFSLDKSRITTSTGRHPGFFGKLFRTGILMQDFFMQDFFIVHSTTIG